MNESLNIYAAFDQPEFLQDLVERLADKRNDSRFISKQVPFGFRTFKSSTIEAYVSGAIGIDIPTGTATVSERIQMPFTTSFLFTCIRANEKTYRMQWVLSLS